MVKVGILGFGFMGRQHFDCYAKRRDVQVVAICDAHAEQLHTDGSSGEDGGGRSDRRLSDVALFDDLERMIETVELDALSITVPTPLHRHCSCLALERGLHVLCEKPMALDVPDCDHMIERANKSGKCLQIGHCIRFWPAYAELKRVVDSGAYGALTVLSMRRFSAKPGWSQGNWLAQTERSGGVELDLHIHDTDFVQYLLGVPRAVFSSGFRDPDVRRDHIVTQYLYDEGTSVCAEGSWRMAPSFGFEMSFTAVMEAATLCFDSSREPSFRVCPLDGEAFTPELPAGDGYDWQVDHFLRSVQGERLPPVTTLRGARESVRIVEAERQSALTGEIVALCGV